MSEQEFIKVIDLLYLAKKGGIEIVLNDERLQLKVPDNIVIDKKLLEEIKYNKSLIKDYLSNEKWKSKVVTKNSNKIPRTNRAVDSEIPLSFSQERLWFIDRLEGSVQYHIPVVLRLKGKLDINALEYALKGIVSRHEVLRTVIYEKDGQPYQHIMDYAEWGLGIIEQPEYKACKDRLEQYIKETISHPFDLSKDYMFRATLIKLNDQEHVLVVTAHHIASDGWSTSIMVKEVAELYSAYTSKRASLLPVLDIQYADFAVWQRNMEQGLIESKIGYWKTKLQNIEPLELPADYPRPLIENRKAASVGFTLGTELTKKLNKFSREQSTSLFMTLLAGFNVLLYRYSGQKDICVGSPIAGRQQQSLESLIGFFVNTLALHNRVEGNISFTQLLQQVKQTTLEAYENQEVPFERIVDAVVKQRDPARHPLFEVMFVLQNTPDIPQFQLGEVKLSIEDVYKRTTALFDLSFILWETSSGLEAKIEYCTDLYNAQTIDRMIAHFKSLLHSVVNNPESRIGLLQMLTPDEEYRLLYEFNKKPELPSHLTVIDLLEQQVLKSPEGISVEYQENKLSYRELNERSNQVCHYLESKGLHKEQLVPVLMERSVEMIIGIWGILKAGGVYVPIDPSYPKDRIHFILRDTRSSLVVTDSSSSGKGICEDNADYIRLDKDWDLIAKHSSSRSISIVHSQDLCYVLYTSGSTGIPKGVMIEHRSLAASTMSRADYYKDLGSVFLIPSISFDASLAVIFGTLIAGGKLILSNANDIKEPSAVKRFLEQSQTILCVPSYYRFLLEENLVQSQSLSRVILGGEKLDQSLVLEHYRKTKNVDLYNEYGPTETTVWATVAAIENGIDQVSIGKPVKSASVYIVDADLQLVPFGVTGELCIGGEQVARGYLNLPEITAQQFIKDPFSKETRASMYRTGDLCKWLPDGNIQYIGRKDDQVKIRGYRIELGEIEQVLAEMKGVKQVAVLSREKIPGKQQLVVYLVAENFNQDNIINFLKERLPDYMIPSVWISMEALPLTPNGKIDKKALPDPDNSGYLSSKYEAPRNATETTLVQIWEEILGVERIGINDNFFESGGHSLLAVRLISAIRKKMAVEMPIKDIFDYPTVGLLAAQIPFRSGVKAIPAIEVHARPERIPLSFSQERLWFIDKLQGSTQYHVPAVLRLRGKLNKDALIHSLQTIVNRHEVLRTVFIEEEGEVQQYITDKDRWELSVISGNQYKNEPEELDRLILELIKKPFDLANASMLRASLIAVDNEEHFLIATLHHIASDGWSKAILVKEVAELYNSYDEGREIQLSPLPIQYADYAIWQRKYLAGDPLDIKLAYWRKKLNGLEPLALPTDFRRPVIHNAKGSVVRFNIDNDISDRLNDLSQQHGSTLFMTLLAAFKVLLHRYSGQQDICVGTPIAGRQQEEVERLIGFFVNTLALRTEVKADFSFVELLQQVKNTTLEAYQNQDVPFEKVVEAVVKARDMSRNPLFQVMFIFQNTPQVSQFKLNNVQLDTEYLEQGTATFDLSFMMHDSVDGLQGSVEYSTALYSGDTIHRMVTHFQQLLNSIVTQSDQQIARLQMLTVDDERELLIDFNNTVEVFPHHKTLVDLFEEQVANTLYNEAILFEDHKLTYQQLNARSNQLAHYLINKGVGKETLVPICVERSLEMIIAIIGILKTGAAYVPIDPEYPQERISIMLEDINPSIILTNNRSKSKLITNERFPIVEVDTDRQLIDLHSVNNLERDIDPNSLAYIIFTSGSTGRPKGVMIEHRAVVNLCFSQSRILDLKPGTKTLQFASFGFDASTSEIFNTLLSGGCLVLCKEEDLLSAQAFERITAKYKIDLVTLPPSYQSIVKDALGGIKTVVSAGEPLIEEVGTYLQSRGIRLINGYGPTENTVCVTMTDDPIKGDRIVIGKPLANVQVYILDGNGNLMPQGSIGEICVGGVQVARGYLNSSEITGEKFVRDPFNKKQDSWLYRTGDLGKWHGDGNMEYFGRKDNQVKIRGYRVELEEIENELHHIGFVRQAVVIAKEDRDGNKFLVAYIVTEGESFDKDAIRQYLGQKLPKYMMPSVLIKQDVIPLTTHGKVDRKSLPDPDILLGLSSVFVGPGTDNEKRLVKIWQQLLRLDRVGVNDNFFELGGHSLLAIRLISAIRKEFGVELSVRDIFEFSTVELLTKQLENSSRFSNLTSVTKVDPRPGNIPLSFSQERLWFIDSLQGSIQYHMPSVLRLQGNVDLKALEFSLQSLLDRHEVLRTVIREDEGLPWQFIKENSNLHLEVIDGNLYGHDAGKLQEYIRTIIRKPFDLSKDNMLRASLITIDENEYVLVITMHHIASDGWSASILIKEVMEFYQSYLQKRSALLPSLNIQYADYAIWQRNPLRELEIKTKTEYWKNKLEAVEPLELPTDFRRPASQSGKGAFTEFNLDKGLSEQVQQLSRQQGSTLFMTLLAAFKVLLHRYTGQQDICVGTPVAGRHQQELEELIGFFINTLALRSRVVGSSTFSDLLKQVKQTTLEAFENQEVPFEKVVDAVVKQRDMSRHPLFQVMFILQNTPEIPELRLGDVSLTDLGTQHSTGLFDLTFTVVENAAGLRIGIQYSTDLFSESTIQRMVSHFRELLHSIVLYPDEKIGSLGMLAENEKQELLKTFNNTTTEYPKDKTISDLFEDQVIETPEAVAVVFENVSLTYKDLNDRANQLAHYLLAKGIKQETLIPICVERSVEMIIGVLGILKAGAAYVPIDPGYPQERISYVLEDTKASIVISSEKTRIKLNTRETEIVELDTEWPMIERQPVHNPGKYIRGKHLAYVIYTSGSTGKPKGVMVEHTSVVNLLLSIGKTIGFTSGSSILSVTTYSFDISYLEFYMPLISGGRLVIADRETAMDGFKLAESIAKYCPTHMQATPSTWQLLVDAGWKNKESVKLLTGGEAIKEDLKETLTRYGLVWNVYGPTETTIWSTIKRLQSGQKVLIGAAIANTTVYILNKDHQLCPVMVAGEICIGGTGLARGYFNQSALTAEKFIANPFPGINGARLYRTGDIGRRLPDGNIEFLGRKDEQVKIRGYRIELGEIEQVLQSQEGTRQAAVITKEITPGNKQLVAYLITEDFSLEKIIAFLKERLPDYMIPSVFISLESFPLTPNGKIDKRALPDPNADYTNGEYVAPRTDWQIQLVQIWQELLGIKRIGITDNFFEIGGHSLLATRTISAIRKKLRVELAIKDLFVFPTIKELAGYLEKQIAVSLLPEIISETRPAEIPLSFSQERLWFIDKLEGSIQYHIPTVLRLKGQLNMIGLENAFRHVVDRHESLRTVILEKNGRAYQHITEMGNWSIQKVDAGFGYDSPELKEYIKHLVSHPFDLSRDNMLRTSLVRLDAQDHILVVTMHHIASDAWSLSIIVKEVVELYSAYLVNRPAQLPSLEIQYADFAIWQRKYLQAEVLNKKLDYWKQKLDSVSPIQLPLDFPRPAIQSIKGASTEFKVDKNLLSSIHLLSQQQGTTLFMTLLTCFKVLLHRYSGQQDICVGTPIAGRQQQEVENLIGLFINTLALRSEVNFDIPFAGLLQHVKQITLEAYDNQDVPFDKVVEAVVKERDLSRSPLFQVMFILQNTAPIQALHFGEVQLSAAPNDQNTTKFDLTFNILETDEGLQCSVEYCTELFSDQTIHRMIFHFQQLLHSIVESPSKNVGELSMISSNEKNQLLHHFNDTLFEYPAEKTVLDLFEQQVTKTPEETAVIFGEDEISYRRLNERSNQVANFLREKGVKKETFIALFIGRGVEMIVAMLGILKSGAAYVPIDPEYPEERIGYIIEDSNVSIILSDKNTRKKLAMLKAVDIIEIDENNSNINDQSSENLQTDIRPDQLAYVIYTSGSTGKPKGVMIEHRNVYSFIHWCHQEFSASHFDMVYAATSICFDLSIFEMFYPLTVGKAVRIIGDVSQIEKYLRSDTGVLINSVPSVIQLLLRQRIDLSNISVMNMAGEPVPLALIEQLDGEKIEIRNLYGPTESTTYSTVYRINRDSPVLIGKPISNTQIYILDKQMGLAPVGITGEIYIGGAGVARGYLNRPELTTEKFIVNPFSKEPGSRIYKTGDLGRWLTDGNLECFGRVDEQVKINGHRIEPGEIESILQKHELVSKALVISKDDDTGNKRLVAYIVPHGTFSPDILGSYLKEKLPRFMVPGQWVELQQIPLTPNGKIDKKALPDLQIENLARTESIAPSNDIEAGLVEIWKRLLTKDEVSVNENFFEAGGHSLLAVELISILRKEFSIEVPLVEIFKHTTIQSLGAYMTKLQAAENVVDVIQESPRIKPNAGQEIGVNSKNSKNTLSQDKGDIGLNGDGKFIIPIKTDGAGIPFFGILSFNQFNILADYMFQDRPIYYLPPTQITAVEDIAAHYVREIKSVKPVGPYIIGGYCAGGKIAMEVAQQLVANGDTVSALILFELYAPQTVLSPTSWKYIKRRLGYYKDRFLNLHSNHSLYDLARFFVFKSASKFSKSFIKVPPPKFVTSTAFSSYTYKPYSGKVILFKASKPPLEINEERPLMGWTDYFTGHVEEISIFGGHLGIFREPSVQKTAIELSNVLKKVNGS